MPGSGRASRMNATQVIQFMSRRAHALRTATRQTFRTRHHALGIAINTARAWIAANPSSPQVGDVRDTLRRTSYTHRAQQRSQAPRDTAARMGKTAASARGRSGGGGGTPAAATPRASGKGGGGGGGGSSRRPAPRRSSPAPANVPGASLPDLPDLGGAAGVGLFSAIGRTFSGDVGPAGLIPMWNPPGPLLGRPAFKLFLLMTGISLGAAATIVAVTASRQKKAAALAQIAPV